MRIFIDLHACQGISPSPSENRGLTLRTRVAPWPAWRSVMRGGAHARNLEGPIGQSLQAMTLITPPKAGP